ncbi:dihydropteroate synthase, partial [Bacillaceae bacterium SIJ1]|uniref:dihydropteroate synthase n=1 Tax=Litoribacterium kuwaitense TaxID=1398745 RepID=UPI0013EA0698
MSHMQSDEKWRPFDKQHKTEVMGIVNVTPDSFSDGGAYNTVVSAVDHALALVNDGADILDIGGESTRPGADYVDEAEETNRVVPVIEALVEKTDRPVSIDTYKSKTAEAAVNAGASIINDVWGGLYDPEILDVAAATKAKLIITHNRKDRNYTDFMTDVCEDLRRQIEAAKKRGVQKEQIILDPGVGFAKSPAQNIEVIRHLDDIAVWG